MLSTVLRRAKGKYAPGDLPPPVAELVTGHASPYVTMVMTDVEGSTTLWEWNSQAMASAITMHDTVMRKLLRRYSGYEVRFASVTLVLPGTPVLVLQLCPTPYGAGCAHYYAMPMPPAVHHRLCRVFRGAAACNRR